MVEFPDHAIEQMRVRGVTREEVHQVIERGAVSDAREPRLARELVFTEGYAWLERHYPHKRVKVIFVREEDTVIVTVYAFYGRWRLSDERVV